MTYEHIIALAGFILVSSATPGPNNLMLMASGANFGLIRTAPHVLGICMGMVVMITLIWFGLAEIFDTYPAVLNTLKIISSGYLLYLAWKIATATGTGKETANASKPFSMLQAALFQWVNPKAWMMALSMITIYRLPFSPEMAYALTLLIFAVIMLPTITAWAFMGLNIKRMLNNPLKLRIFNWTCAGALIATLYPVFF